MTLSVGQKLKQTNPDGTPMNTLNYTEHTYSVEGIYGSSYETVITGFGVGNHDEIPGTKSRKTYLVVLAVEE